MLEEKENEEQDEIEELKTFSISESIKMRREKSKQRKQEYEEKLQVLQEKIDKLKKESEYECNTILQEKKNL
ncbi:TPA: hypothetical protein QC175_005710 [Bacillus cereus]|nr:hypothetical protein [Bacillus cereus]HDR8330678.1 hypothetical protein [Bacillus cereus]HDR8338253.1 hypothetical protein [Bacillus cereus]